MTRKSKAITKPRSHQERKRKLSDLAHYQFDPKQLVRKATKALDAHLENTDDVILSGEADEAVGAALPALALDTHYEMALGATSRLQPLVVEMADMLIKEYECEGASERALAELAAGAYVRVIDYSRAMSVILDTDWISNEKNGHHKILSNEIDRANRHYVSAITALRQLKSPAMEVTVKAKTAFVANNQQVNAHNAQQANTEYEINASK